MGTHVGEIDLNEKYTASGSLMKKIIIILALGIALFAIGAVIDFSASDSHDEHHALVDTAVNDMADHHDGAHGHKTVDEHAGHDHGHHGPSKFIRIFNSLWYNSVFFAGISVIGLFFVAFNYVANAGWSASIKRIAEAFGAYIPIAGIITLVLFFFVSHDIFHWTHASVYEEGTATFDAIINGKKAFFFGPGAEGGGLPLFYILRMVIFFGGWTLFWNWLRNLSLAEDKIGGETFYRKSIRVSAGFIVFFGVSSSIGAWDWIMSIDTHWFSTMFGWYAFASWFVTGLAGMTLTVLYLKDAGYLKIVNENHIHDLGKLVFAFSIFWTYIWFSQFLLIYYSNIAEETIYFIDRLHTGVYKLIMFLMLFLNFFFPFLALMTRDAKRKNIMLKVVCTVVIVGHWLDFYQMVTPGVLKTDGAFGLLEIGTGMIFLSLFIFVVSKALEKAPLIAKNHPMLDESINHHI